MTGGRRPPTSPALARCSTCGAAAGGFSASSGRAVGVRRRRAPGGVGGPAVDASNRSALRTGPRCLSRQAPWCFGSSTSSPSWRPATATRRVGAVVTEAILPRTGLARDPGASPIFESALVPLTLARSVCRRRRDVAALCVQPGSLGWRATADCVRAAAWPGRPASWPGGTARSAWRCCRWRSRWCCSSWSFAMRWTGSGVPRDSRHCLARRWPCWCVRGPLSAGPYRPTGNGRHRLTNWMPCGYGRLWTGSRRHCSPWPWSRSCSTWWHDRDWPVGRVRAVPIGSLCCSGRLRPSLARRSALILIAHTTLLRGLVRASGSHGLSFGLYPLDTQRLVLVIGLLCANAAALWLAVAVLRLAASWWRVRRGGYARRVAMAAVFVAGALSVAALAGSGSVDAAL